MMARRTSGFQGMQPLARPQSVPVGTLGTLAFRFSAIGVVAVLDWNMLGRGCVLFMSRTDGQAGLTKLATLTRSGSVPVVGQIMMGAATEDD